MNVLGVAKNNERIYDQKGTQLREGNIPVGSIVIVDSKAIDDNVKDVTGVESEVETSEAYDTKVGS